MKIEKNILAPFCIFFILMGIGGLIILPTVNAFWLFEEATYLKLFDLGWLAGAIIAFFYSTIVLRDLLKGSFTEKIMYCFLASVFIGLIAFPFFR